MYIESSYKFIKYLRTNKNASVHTIRNYAIDLNSLKDFMEKEWCSNLRKDELPDKIRPDSLYEERWKGKDKVLPLDRIDRKTIRGFLAHLNAEKSSKRTIVRKMSLLRTFFKWAVSSGLVKENPTEEIESPKLEKKIPTYLSYQQLTKLFSEPDTDNYLGFRDRAIMELFYSSGLRVSELIALNRADFDRKNMLLKVRGKGRKERVVPITPNAAKWITDYLEHPERERDIDGHQPEQDHEAVFLNRLGTRLTTRSVDRKFDTYLKQSGLSGKITPHTIRHTIATHWLEKGMDLKTIQEILGHRCLSTTTIYTKVNPSLKKEVYEKTHPRAK